MKSGRGYSGSTHWNNSVRSRLYFTSVTAGENDEEPDPDLRMLELAKSNRARNGQKLWMRWKDGRFVPESSQDGNDIGAQIAVEVLFLELLDKLTSQGRNVCATPGVSFAPKLFCDQPEAKEKRVSSKSQFKTAMENLLTAGKIKNVEEGPPSRRRNKLVRAGRQA
jgi:hypothetical protein